MDKATCGPPQALLIYTDASFAMRIGSWGAVIRGLETELQWCGAFNGDCESSEQAELQAIAIVLHRLAREGHLRAGASVMVFTDNRACHFALSGIGKFKRNVEAMNRAMAVLRNVIAARQLAFRCCWIKGHQPLGQTVHGDANRIADRLARQAHPMVPTKAAQKLASRTRKRERLARAREEAAAENVARVIANPENALQVQL